MHALTAADLYIKPITLEVHLAYPRLAVSIIIVDAAFAVEIAGNV
jgi:hypothetical protein